MSEKNNNGKGIFYGVIGVATLIVAIIGATFAYFTATQTNDNVITGNAATISFGLNVTKVTNVDETKGGLIPMSNSMVEAAVSATDPCVDNNGNAVCQIYKITVTNSSTVALFLDGYVTLANNVATGTATDDATATTTMRWAQVFTNAAVYTTAGTSTAGYVDAAEWSSLDNADTESMTVTSDTGKNLSNVYGATGGPSSTDIVKTNATFASSGANLYDVIQRNYIRTSKRAEDAAAYVRSADLASALVFNQSIAANTGTQDIYIVVWLSETGTNQNIDRTASETANLDFFNGKVTFISAQGGEVSATFNGYTRVAPTDNTTA